MQEMQKGAVECAVECAVGVHQLTASPPCKLQAHGAFEHAEHVDEERVAESHADERNSTEAVDRAGGDQSI